MTAKIAAFVVLTVCLLLPAKSRAESWYLMEAPGEANLDASCHASGAPVWRDYVAALRYWEPVPEARLLRCLRESLIDVPGARLSQWIKMAGPAPDHPAIQVSSFKSRGDCEAARNSRMTEPIAAQGLPPGWKVELYQLFTYDYQPSLRGKVYIRDKRKARRALAAFEREHRHNDRALTYAAFLKQAIQRQRRRRPTACIASTNPGLLHPAPAAAASYWPSWLAPLMQTPYVANAGAGG